MTHAEMVEKIAEEFLRVRRMQPPEDRGVQMWADARAYVSDAATAATRTGYVPLEATEEMVEAGTLETDQPWASVIYSRMIGARPGQEKEDV